MQLQSRELGLALVLSLLLICQAAAAAPLQNITIHVHVPAGTGTVYLTGNLPGIGLWNPQGLAMSGEGVERIAVLHLPPGTQLEYKFTLGSWDRESLGPSGTVMPNYRLTVDGDTNVFVVISDFEKAGPQAAQYIADWQGSGVVGRLVYWTNVVSTHLAPNRNVEIWLPPDYDAAASNRYDVLYMHDGQNLFDPRLANTGVAWGVDQAVSRCVNTGRIPPVIVVGVWNTSERLREYSPWDLGTNYADFLIEELMPRVNAQFRTRTGPEHASVMGSSMGGLISFWLCWQHPDVFGRAGCLSTSFQWTRKFEGGHMEGTPLIEGEFGRHTAMPRGIRLYFDYGLAGLDASCAPEQNKVSAWLKTAGLVENQDFVVRTFPGADHNETAWRARLVEPLTFLYANWRTSQPRTR